MATIIQGRVLGPDGRPVADAAVYIVASPGAHPDIALLTGADGRYALPAVAVPGRYRVGASAAEGQGVAEVVLAGSEASAVLDIPLGGGP